jgi:hypothetical protein
MTLKNRRTRWAATAIFLPIAAVLVIVALNRSFTRQLAADRFELGSGFVQEQGMVSSGAYRLILSPGRARFDGPTKVERACRGRISAVREVNYGSARLLLAACGEPDGELQLLLLDPSTNEYDEASACDLSRGRLA